MATVPRAFLGTLRLLRQLCRRSPQCCGKSKLASSTASATPQGHVIIVADNQLDLSTILVKVPGHQGLGLGPVRLAMPLSSRSNSRPPSRSA